MIEVLIILTFISLFFISIGEIKNKDMVISSGWIMLVLIVFFGWGALGIFVPINNNNKSIENNSIIKEQYIIIVKVIEENEENDTLEFIFDKKIDFDNITDTTTFYLEKEKNMYGFKKKYYLSYKKNTVLFYNQFFY